MSISVIVSAKGVYGLVVVTPNISASPDGFNAGYSREVQVRRLDEIASRVIRTAVYILHQLLVRASRPYLVRILRRPLPGERRRGRYVIEVPAAYAHA